MTTITRDHKVAVLTRRIKACLDKRVASYTAECEDDAANGYRPHYCYHGTNLWTDYDPICGWCESEGSNGIPYYWETDRCAEYEANKALEDYENLTERILSCTASLHALRGNIRLDVIEQATGSIIKDGAYALETCLWGLSSAEFSRQCKYEAGIY